MLKIILKILIPEDFGLTLTVIQTYRALPYSFAQILNIGLKGGTVIFPKIPRGTTIYLLKTSIEPAN